MTIVEFFLFLAAGAGIYLLLKPLQKRLEVFLLKFLNSKPSKPGPVIDITDYSQKDKK